LAEFVFLCLDAATEGNGRFPFPLVTKTKKLFDLVSPEHRLFTPLPKCLLWKIDSNLFRTVLGNPVEHPFYTVLQYSTPVEVFNALSFSVPLANRKDFGPFGGFDSCFGSAATKKQNLWCGLCTYHFVHVTPGKST
jgi:hypothetical protein